MSDIAVKEETAVVRPLKVLTELINYDFEQAEKAGMEYYKAAGEKLVEAKEGHFKGRSASEFYAWAEKTFGKKPKQTRLYMALLASPDDKSFKSLRDFRRETGKDKWPIGPGTRIHREWTAPVDSVAKKAQQETKRLIDTEIMTRRQEREAEMQLGLRLIDIGFKVLAKELHPDKVGGSREGMKRLNRVRDRLKANV